jgi:hypothetical protein
MHVPHQTAEVSLMTHDASHSGEQRRVRAMVRVAMLVIVVGCSGAISPGQAPQSPLPDAPEPRISTANPCDVRNAGGSIAATAAIRATAVIAAGGSGNLGSPTVVSTTLCVPHLPIVNWYARFLTGPQVKALTPLQKAHLAARNLIDPFNLLTIFGEAGIAVAANSHSPYGPGMTGYGKYAGVSLTEDMTGEFFGTFLIPSIVHQDPHYHRMPSARIPRRIAHAIYQIAWTQGDNGKGMINYADLVGFAIDDEIGNLYVPDQRTNVPASAERYAIGLATAPVDNFVTEFVPDIARHIHVQIVVIQRIINQVAKTDQTTTP